MADREAFISEIQSSYTHKGMSFVLGKGKLADEVVPETEVTIPLKSLNRHGLISGATGTGKTKTLQIIAEQLSLQGIPSIMMDLKGDLSGLAAPGDAENKHIVSRHEKLGFHYKAIPFPVELMTMSSSDGVKLRATVSEFGPILFSKILGLNDTQQSIMSILFKYCDDKKLPLVDLNDMKEVLKYVTESEQGKNEVTSNYGRVSSNSIGAILRKIVGLQQQGADSFFGEPSFDTEDLLRTQDGIGVINIVRLIDIQDVPQLFSTFMLSLLAEIYSTFPEVGDQEKPKLVLFLDEAHLFFKEASKALLDQIENMVKLIRSKGVGIFFITQVPADIPDQVLGQLGLKIQHALRGFTAKDRKAIKKAIENYPISTFYKADELVSNLGIGEAFVTALNEKGIPTALVHTYLRAPASRMDILTPKEVKRVVSQSELAQEYNVEIDKETAYEILQDKMKAAQEQANEEPEIKTRKSKARNKKEESIFSEVMNSPLVRDIGRTLAREFTKATLGVLGIKGKKSRRKSFF